MGRRKSHSAGEKLLTALLVAVIMGVISTIAALAKLIGSGLKWIYHEITNRPKPSAPLPLNSASFTDVVVRRDSDVDIQSHQFFLDLPERIISVPSSTGSATYQVNLAMQTCTCPNFVEDRHVFPRDDLRRFCKHLCGALLETNNDSLIRTAWDENILPIQVTHDYLFGSLRGSYPILVHKNPEREWCDVVARQKASQTYHRFGYSPQSRRWSYHESPQDAAFISTVLNKRYGAAIPNGRTANIGAPEEAVNDEGRQGDGAFAAESSLKSINHLDSENAVKLLIQLSSNVSPEIRGRAADECRTFTERIRKTVLKKNYTFLSPAQRPDIFEILRKLASDRDSTVRLKAAYALGDHPGESTLRLLDVLGIDSEERVRVAANHARTRLIDDEATRNTYDEAVKEKQNRKATGSSAT